MENRFPSGERTKIYFPQLDSIRGMSFIAIFLFHTLRIGFTAGGFSEYLFNCLPFAIDVFFILSSFLLTYLALNEYKKRRNFSFKNYFTRRVLRIWPLYYFIITIAFILFPFLAKLFHYNITLPAPLYYIFFIANFYTADHVFFLKLLWTISVEEQFYLLWGLCLRFFYKYLTLIIILLFVFSISFSLYSIVNGIKYYFNTITYLFDFGSGALGAMLIFKNNFIVRSIRKLNITGTYTLYSYIIFHFIIFYFFNKKTFSVSNDLVNLASRYLFILYIALIIVEQMVNERRTKFFEKNRFLIYTGRISYGLYCFHGITILAINLLMERLKIDTPNWLIVCVYFLVNYCIASLSYFYLEAPFLRLKSKWRRA